MTARTTVNAVAGRAPIVMSLIALGLVLFAVTTGWERTQTDEGAAAHIFQLLIALEAPLVALYLWTADWARRRAVLTLLALQAAAVVLALGSVKAFGL